MLNSQTNPESIQEIPTPLTVKAPKPKGLGLCFIAVRLPRKVLRLLHRGTQAVSPQDIDGSVDVPIVV